MLNSRNSGEDKSKVVVNGRKCRKIMTASVEEKKKKRGEGRVYIINCILENKYDL